MNSALQPLSRGWEVCLIFLAGLMGASCFSEPVQALSDFQLGGYEVSLDPQTAQLQITRQHPGQAAQVLLRSAPGATWLQAEERPLQVLEQRGSFAFHSTLLQRCQQLKLGPVQTDAQSWTLSGSWQEQHCGQTWQLKLSLSQEGHLRFGLRLSPDGPLKQLTLVLQQDPTENWYGGGEQFSFPRLNGQLLPVWVQENGIGRGGQPLSSLIGLFSPGSAGHALSSYISVPWLFSQQGRGLALENAEYSEWDLRQANRLRIQVWAPELRLRLLGADSPLALLKQYTAWAGRMPEPPDWADQGAWVGMQGGTVQVRAVWEKLQQRQTPLAAFWLQDWVGKRKTSIGSQLWWNWQLNATHYPDWPALVQELNRHDVKVLGYLNPFLVDVADLEERVEESNAKDFRRNFGRNPRRNLYAEAREQGFLLKDVAGDVLQVKNTDFSAGMLDLSHPGARAWFKQVVRSQVLGVGLSGWMADYGEALPLEAHLHSAESPATAHNRYAQDWARLQHEILAENPQAQALVFLRSGFSQSPRWAPFFWQGDQTVTWDGQDGLRSAVQGLISGGLSGFSLNHSDAGGYTSVCQAGLGLCRSPELLMRWLEVNAWTSLLRSHEGNQPEAQAQIYSSPELTDFFDRQARIYTAWRFLRRQLFALASQEGAPVVRHLFLHHPQDPEAAQIHDQFLLGPDLLVAPVLEPGARSRRVYLPPGPWVHLWTGKVYGLYQKGSWVELSAPLGQAPVFYRRESDLGPKLLQGLRAQGISLPF